LERGPAARRRHRAERKGAPERRELPLWERLYSDPCYTAIVRAVGYQACLYRDLAKRLRPLVEEFGERQVETASLYLPFYEGQVLRNAKPLAELKLRQEARKHAVGLLGLPPEHPWHDVLKRGEHLPYSWEEPQPQPTAETAAPKRRRRKQSDK
jgi:hypothetical protein